MQPLANDLTDLLQKFGPAMAKASLGILLGDGCLRGNQVSISTNDIEVIEDHAVR